MRLQPFLTLITVTTLICSSCSHKPKEAEKIDENHLKIASNDDPLTFDPRLARDLFSSTVMRMLFEGLMRTSSDGSVKPALAEKVEISQDLKTYTFTLRPSTWSDGTPLTASDFERSWKSMLKPDFPAPNVHQLYVIKGAKEAREGRDSLDNVGIKASGPHTLVVSLNQPTPYFLELTSCYFFLPVSPQHPDSATVQSNTQQPHIATNGPFVISNWTPRSEFVVVKNPKYWDAAAVKLDKITLQILDENTGLQLFKAGKLDWTGSPLSTMPQDAVSAVKEKGELGIATGAGTHWFRFNNKEAPFNNEKMRRAFGLALNRQEIVDHVTQGNQKPAIGIVPPEFGIEHQNYYPDHDISNAKTLFAMALDEAGLSQKQLPKLTLSYASTERNHKIAQAVQQQWNKTFGLDIALESVETQVYLTKIRSGTYQIGFGSWYADYQDPINFLEVFKSKDTPMNQTFWENIHYARLLDQSSLETNPAKRMDILGEAEKLLIEAMPIAPLFFNAYNYLKKDDVKGVYFSPMGFLDFKEAYLSTSKETAK